MVRISKEFEYGTVSKDTTSSEVDIKRLKSEISKKASMANKRLRRLEDKGLTNNPAYNAWSNYGGGEYFSVKGKSYNELQAELSRVNHFIESKTSTIRGTNKVLRQMANTSGLQYDNLPQLYKSASKFFELASKTEQYLKNTTQMAGVINYQRVWEAINTYVAEQRATLNESIKDIDSMVGDIADLSISMYSKIVIDAFYDAF